MPRRRPKSPFATLDSLPFGARRFEDSLELLTRDSITTSLDQIEAALKARFGVAPSETAPGEIIDQRQKR